MFFEKYSNAEMRFTMNFFNPKNQRKIAAAICILVIIAMIVPMVLGAI